MSANMTPENATALRRPFPKESIGVLPKPYKKESPKGNCNECGGYHGLPAVHLDYVGHAATTERLLTVDPEWTWDFGLHRADGTPVLDDGSGNLWIRLTVCGVTRLGVGDGASMKERIGDAIRNAAMRFGVALDLWAKEDLVEFAQAVRAHAATEPPAPAPAPRKAPQPVQAEKPGEVDGGDPMSARTRGRLFALFGEKGIDDRDEQIRGIAHVIGRPIASRSELTEDEARAVIDRLTAPTGASA